MEENLYAIEPALVETIDLAANKLYAADTQPPLDKDTCIRLPSFAVSKVHFMARGQCYKQCDRVAMGSTLEVTRHLVVESVRRSI